MDEESATEDDLVELIGRMLGAPPPGRVAAGEVWIGDDAAVVPSPHGQLLLGIDAVVAGVHADTDLVSLDDVGRKAMVVNLSDIAAMGGRPLHAVVSVVAARSTDVVRLYEGIAEAATAYDCPVVGGDLSNGPGLVVSVAITGTVDGAPVLRSGARPGDGLFVTGPVGAAAAGLEVLRRIEQPVPGSVEAVLAEAHRRPLARLKEGTAAREGGASAMIDVSDGLSADLGRLATASRVGARLDDVPVAPGASLDQALGGGEDYELVFAAADQAVIEESFSTAGLRSPIRIGTCTGDPAERSLAGGALRDAGWHHRF